MFYVANSAVLAAAGCSDVYLGELKLSFLNSDILLAMFWRTRYMVEIYGYLFARILQ